MNKARIAILGLALVAAIGAAVLVSSMSGKAPAVVEAPRVETVQVLVAGDDIALGTLITAANLSWQEWPKAALSSHLITKDASPDAKNKFKGATVRVPFVKGEPMIDRKIIRQGEGGFMAAILPEGMRAISVKISPETGAGGFILPNDRVDVLLTRRIRSSEGASTEGHVSETVLTNVRILAIDQAFRDNGKGDQVAVGKTATLELKLPQAELLALAEAMGDLSLALRSIKDSSNLALGQNGPQSRPFKGRDTSGTVTLLRYGVSSTVNSK